MLVIEVSREGRGISSKPTGVTQELMEFDREPVVVVRDSVGISLVSSEDFGMSVVDELDGTSLGRAAFSGVLLTTSGTFGLRAVSLEPLRISAGFLQVDVKSGVFLVPPEFFRLPQEASAFTDLLNTSGVRRKP